jgi:D-aminopeptidase
MSNEVSHCRYVAQTDFVHAAIGYHARAPTVGCTLSTSLLMSFSYKVF